MITLISKNSGFVNEIDYTFEYLCPKDINMIGIYAHNLKEVTIASLNTSETIIENHILAINHTINGINPDANSKILRIKHTFKKGDKIIGRCYPEYDAIHNVMITLIEKKDGINFSENFARFKINSKKRLQNRYFSYKRKF
jgi:hypothetical protein